MLVLGHRGLSSRFPENTFAAFDAALKEGADGFECDLRLTADDQVVIFHDDNFKRLCNAQGSIESLEANELSNFKIKGSEGIPLFKDFLKRYPKAILNLELKKTERFSQLVQKTLEVLKANQRTDGIYLSSFCSKILRELKNQNSAWPLALIFDRTDSEDFRDVHAEKFISIWSMGFSLFHRDVVSGIWRFEKKPFWLWTLNKESEWKIANDHGVEAVMSDKPDELRKFLKT